MIDQKMLEAYRDRWRSVADIEATERRTSSVAQRWRKMNALLRMAVGLELHLDRNDLDDEAVRGRWVRLAELYMLETGRQVQ
jgi:hypothetical protein